MSKPFPHLSALTGRAIVLAALVTLPWPATAREPCPVVGPEPGIYGNTWIQVDERTSLRLVEGFVRLIVDGRVKSSEPVFQPDNGPADTLLEVSSGKYFVLGPARSYLFTLTDGDDGIEMDTPVELPILFAVPCKGWDRLFGVCTIAAAEYSPALNAVTMSGLNRFNNWTATLVFRDDSEGRPLETDDGTPLRYRWDDKAGNAIARTGEWDGYVITKTETISCSAYLESHPDTETYATRPDP